MLRHHSSEGEDVAVNPPAADSPTATPAGKVRVTPEELMQAMAAIQARREQEARERDATITIGEAVQELGLDASPEEILAVVQAQRNRRQTPARGSRRLSPWRAAVLSLVVSVGGWMLLRGTAALVIVRPAPAIQTPATVTPNDAMAVPVMGDFDGDGRIDVVVPSGVNYRPTVIQTGGSPPDGSLAPEPGSR